jgi:uncharacterized membrane protein
MADDASADRRMADRMINFSDAVFAVALTLLALELTPPASGEGVDFWAGVLEMVPDFASLLISFALASLWWAVHMSATREMTVFDWPTAIFNLVFLFFIVLLPFSAATFASNMQAPEPLALYWMINAGASFAMTLMFFVMSRDKGRLIGGIGPGERMLRLFQALAPGIVFSLGAYWGVTDQIWLSRFCCVLLAPLMMFSGIFGGMMQRSRLKKAAA